MTVRLQEQVERLWTESVVDLLERSGKTQADLARLMGVHRSGLQHFLGSTRHPTIDIVKRINSAMGKLLGNGFNFQAKDVTAYLDSLVADSLDADAEGGFMRGLDLIEPYLRANALTEIMQARRETGAASLLHDVNRAWRREVIRRIDGTVPPKLFVDEITAIFQKHGISLQKWFKSEPEIRKYRALGNVVRVIRIALARTGAPVALRNELEGTIIPAVLDLVHDGHSYDRFRPSQRGSKQ
jgi:transcriptional regulator with XRE-family HTH domain